MSATHHEHAVKGTEGMPESKAKQSVDFAALFHVASDPTLQWPETVQAWGDKFSANQLQVLIAEVLKAAKG